MTVLVTGVAGFIGFHVAYALLKKGEQVVGIDNLSPYYDVSLKKARLAQLSGDFIFHGIDITDKEAMLYSVSQHPDITEIVHCAAQAGVRYSLQNPYSYEETNIKGWLVLLEICRILPLRHCVYASSSSVYGANTKLPFSVTDPVEHPISFYAVTKRTNELMAEAYHNLYNLPLTGLRFFTVYGPWGRPDMSAFIFMKALLEDAPVPLFNHGNMRRNFTYIDDIVSGIIACLQRPVVGHKIYNLGNDRSESLIEFLEILEMLTGKKAKKDFQDIKLGDVSETLADLTESRRDFGFSPEVCIKEGLKHFVDWYKEFYHV